MLHGWTLRVPALFSSKEKYFEEESLLRNATPLLSAAALPGSGHQCEVHGTGPDPWSFLFPLVLPRLSLVAYLSLGLLCHRRPL